MTDTSAPTSDWTKVNYQLPNDVETYEGPGRAAIRDLSRAFIHLTTSWPRVNTSAISRAEAVNALCNQIGHRRQTVLRAWSALKMRGLIISIYDEPTAVQERFGHHVWSGPPANLLPGEPDRYYEREVDRRKAEEREDSLVRATSWGDILRREGWADTGRNSSCGCPTWTAPGRGTAPALATAHDPGCSLYTCEYGQGTLYVHSDDAPGAVGVAIHGYSSRTITKTQLVVYGQRLVHEFLAIKGKDVESEAERRFWESYVNLRPLALDGLTPQHKVPPYRLDFAIPDKKIGIEIDGYEYHSDKETFTNDRRRERDLELVGWRLIRFSGKEACDTPDQCVLDAARLVTIFQGAN